MASNGRDGRAARRPEPGVPSSSGHEPDGRLDARLENLEAALDKVRPVSHEKGKPDRASGADYSKAVRMSSEFVAAILVGAALGWGLDWIAGTGPWGLIVMMMFGFAAGVLNVLRSAGTTTTPRTDGPGDKGGAG